MIKKNMSLHWIWPVVLCIMACTKDKQEDVVYETFKVTKKDLIESTEVNASVQMEDYTDIFAPVGGRLEKLYIEEGQMVRRGQKIGYMSSDARVRMLDMAAHKNAAEVAYWRKQILPTFVFASTSGKVIQIPNQPGDKVKGFVARVSKGEIIRAQVDEIDLPSVKKGQDVHITFDVDKDTTYAGVLSKIAQVSKKIQNVNVYPIEIKLPSSEDMKPFEPKIGMSVTVQIPTLEIKDAMALSLAAVNNQSNVSIEVETKSGDKKNIVLGQAFEDQVHVKSGLVVGDEIRVPKFQNQKGTKKKSLFDLAGK